MGMQVTFRGTTRAASQKTTHFLERERTSLRLFGAQLRIVGKRFYTDTVGSESVGFAHGLLSYKGGTMSRMELHLWRSQQRWPQRLYLGTMGWNLQTWTLESGPSPVSENRAKHLFAIVDALTTMAPPAVRTEESLRRALLATTESAVFRTAENLTVKYGPVLDVRLRYPCPYCPSSGRLRINNRWTSDLTPMHLEPWRVQRPPGHPDEHNTERECRVCAAPWEVSGTAPHEHLPIAPVQRKTNIWKVREARFLCEVAQERLNELASSPSERERLRALLVLPHFQAIVLRGGLKPFIKMDRTLEEFLTPEMTALCKWVSDAQSAGLVDLKRLASDGEPLEAALDRLGGVGA